MSDKSDNERDLDPLDDPEERRVLFAALDSFRYVRGFMCTICSIFLFIAGKI